MKFLRLALNCSPGLELVVLLTQASSRPNIDKCISAQIIPLLPDSFFSQCYIIPYFLPLGPAVKPSVHRPKLHTETSKLIC